MSVAPRPSSHIRTLSAIVVALIVALAAPGVALAQCPQTTLGEVEKEVMCPVCGTPLALATEAAQAEEQREFILERVESCQSKEEIKSALVAEFGEAVLATPGGDGFDILGYVLPGLAVIFGAGTVGLAAMRWRRSRPASAGGGGATTGAGDGNAAGAGGTAPSDPSAEDERLNADLERYDV